MITYAFLHFFTFVLSHTLGLIPLPGPPDWLTSHSGAIAHVFQAAQHLGVWFPVGLVSTILAALAIIWALAFGIKAARMSLSLFTGGGGGAA